MRDRTLAMALPSPPLTHELRLELVVSADASIPMRADLCYDPTDPFAVTVRFHPAGGPAVVWVVARDLLATGLVAPAGEGDVGVWPSIALDSSDRPAVCLALSAPSGQAILQASSADLRAFLAASYGLVPPGTESSWLDLDALVGRLLSP